MVSVYGAIKLESREYQLGGPCGMRGYLVTVKSSAKGEMPHCNTGDLVKSSIHQRIANKSRTKKRSDGRTRLVWEEKDSCFMDSHSKS